MNIIYCDNFRGFQDTLFSFTDVNFLVGENSTGKTSVMSLLAVLHSIEFWYYNTFNKDPINLGYFSDLSADPKGKITIGCVRESRNSREPGAVFVRCRYRNIDNIPVLDECRIRGPKFELVCSIQDSQLSYTYIPASGTDPLLSDPGTFSRWVRDSSTRDATGSLSIEGREPRNLGLLVAIQLVESELYQKKQIRLESAAIFWPFYGDESIVWIAPIRAKPKRTYDSYTAKPSPEGDHIPYVLNELSRGRQRSDISNSMRKFGNQSGLFDNITTKPYGKSKTAPFEINVKLGTVAHKIANVGYGLSQVLPVLVESLINTNATWFLIQQPEIHLHPRAQAALGNLFFELGKQTARHFIIETHSDYVIDRFRILMGEERKKEPRSAQVLFFAHSKGKNTATALPIDAAGRYPSEQPSGFRDFFVREQLRLLDL